MGENKIERHTNSELAPLQKVRQLRAMLAQIKAQQAPTARFTEVETILFNLQDVDSSLLFQTRTHCVIIMTLTPPQDQVLFALPEVDVFVSDSSGTPTMSAEYAFPLVADEWRHQFISASVWFDWQPSNGKDIVAKVFVRNRAETSAAHPANYNPKVLIATRWRYMVPGSAASQEGIQYDV